MMRLRSSGGGDRPGAERLTIGWMAVGLLSAGALGMTAAREQTQPSVPRAAQPFEIGRPFPTLVLPDAAQGRPRSIADFRGRKTLLHVFASW